MLWHDHVVMETPEANLSQEMRRLNGTFTQRFNRRHQLVWDLLHGRSGSATFFL